MAFWSIAAPIIGGLLGAKGQRDAAKAQAEAGKLDLAELRRQALDYGFNPLTVLQATGGRGFETSAAVPGFLSFLAGQAPAMGQAIGNALNPQTKADLDLTRSQTALNNQMILESQNRPQDASVAQGNRAEDDYLAAYASDPGGYTLMRSMSGAPIEVRNDILYRLGLKPGSLYGMAEDAEATFGEIGGEFTGIGNIGDAGFGANSIVRKVEEQGPVQPALRRDRISVSTLPKPTDAGSRHIDGDLLPPFLQKIYEGEWWKKNMWLDN